MPFGGDVPPCPWTAQGVVDGLVASLRSSGDRASRLAAFSRREADETACLSAETSRRPRGLHRVSWTGWERLYDLRATAHRAWRPSHGERQMKRHAFRQRRPAVPVDCTGCRGRAESVSTTFDQPTLRPYPPPFFFRGEEGSAASGAA